MDEVGRRAVFLDRDGVLNVDHGYVHRLKDLQVLPGVPEAMTKLSAAGFRLIVVSNQSGVARGLFDEEAVRTFNDALEQSIVARGGPRFDDILFCPHHPEAKLDAYRLVCHCRKPAPGMILEAVRKFAINLQGSWMVGDKTDDIECARRAGITQAIQVAGKDPGPPHSQAKFVVPSLAAAAERILQQLH